MADPWLVRPWRLRPNRVSRFYRGGLLLDRFRGVADPTDTNEPEDWIGSATRAWTRADVPATDEGLGTAEVEHETRRVADVLAADPVAIGGKAGAPGDGTPPSTGILVKLLDAGVRLPVHLHPTRRFAASHLGSPYGKAEAWIVLATRPADDGGDPEIRLGFRRDVDRDELRGWIERQDATALLDAMHVRRTRPGDVWFVPPGTPHAIGAGIFLLEVQEPTDFSIVLETAGFPVAPEDAHLGLGWDLMVDAVDRTGLDEGGLERLRGSWTMRSQGGSERGILPAAAAPFFWAEAIRTDGRLAPELPPAFVVGAVTTGHGIVATEAGELPVRAGDTFAIPAAAVAGVHLEAFEPLEVLVCGGTPR